MPFGLERMYGWGGGGGSGTKGIRFTVFKGGRGDFVPGGGEEGGEGRRRRWGEGGLSREGVRRR